MVCHRPPRASIVRFQPRRAACIAVVLTAGCSHTREPLGSPPLSTAAIIAPPQASYRIGPLDTITVKVLGEPDLMLDQQPVALEGTLSMPLLGQVPAAGRTAAQLAKEITDGLNRKYLRDAQVSVAVIRAVNYTVTVSGEVKKPGVFEIPGRATLMQAISLGEGFTGDADSEDVIVIRQIDGQRYAARFPIRDIQLARVADPMLQQSDLVIVGASGRSRMIRLLISTLPALAAITGVFLALR